MFCKKCGKALNSGQIFCSNCGEKVENEVNQTTTDNLNENIEIQQDVKKINQIESNNSINKDTQKLSQTNIQHQNLNNKNWKSLISLIVGIITVLLSFLFNIFIIPFSIAGLVFGIIDKNKNGKTIAGIILNSIAFIVSILIFIIFLITNTTLSGQNYNNNNGNNNDENISVFYGDGFTLQYGSEWQKTTSKNTSNKEVDILVYGNNEAYFYNLGSSSLEDSEDQLDIDFETNNGKMKLYEYFYNYWSESATLSNGSNGFNKLNDDYYYATMDYGRNANNINGKLYLVVSEDNNAILSFMSNIINNFDQNSERILTILKTMEITKTYDDDTADYLDSMSSWNQYSNLRQGSLGTKKTINGGWRILNSYETYWVFKDGEFWWYKSLYDLNDNYWYGTTKILTGEKGFKEVGLDENKIDQIITNSNGKINSNNIYTIILTPKKIISNNEDKSSTNISGEDWHMVWIIVDHGSEGLEAQVFNVKTAETSYYVKIND